MIKKTSVQGIISRASAPVSDARLPGHRRNARGAKCHDAGISFAVLVRRIERTTVDLQRNRTALVVRRRRCARESLRNTEKPTALRGGVFFPQC